MRTFGRFSLDALKSDGYRWSYHDPQGPETLDSMRLFECSANSLFETAPACNVGRLRPQNSPIIQSSIGAAR